MAHGLMVPNVVTDAAVDAALVGMQASFPIKVLIDDFGHGQLVSVFDMERTDLAAALYQRNYTALLGRANAALGIGVAARAGESAGSFPVAVVGLVHFHDAAVAAHRGQLAIPHGFA